MRGLLQRVSAVSSSLAKRTGARRRDRPSILSVSLALALIEFLAVPSAFAQFQPPVGPIGTVVSPDTASPVTHTGAAGTFTLTRQVMNSGNTIRYTVDRPGTLGDVVFERTRPNGSTEGFNVTAAFVGDHGLIFRVFDADTVNVRNAVVFLDLSQSSPIQRNLYSRQDFEFNNPNPQFFRNADGSSLFTRVFLVTTAFPDTSELSVFRMDTGALLCSMVPQDRQLSDTFTAEILDLVGPAGSDTVRIRHQASGGADVATPAACPLAAPAPPQTTRVSVRSDGTQANDMSLTPAVSRDGRFVAFRSFATNLVPNDTNGVPDIFVHDRNTGTTARVSVSSSGAQANGNNSATQAISADGRFVAFHSSATNLVANDTNGVDDVFVHDRNTATTTRVSVSSSGAQANNSSARPALSADGRFVAFSSNATNLVANDTNGRADIFVRDRTNGTTTRVSVTSGGTQATGGSSSGPAISADGQIVAFSSNATNLVANDTNGLSDVFVHDRTTGTTTRVSVTSGGTQAVGGSSFLGGISGDGRFVAFNSDATNLVANDTNGGGDVFVHDRNTGTTTRVSVSSSGAQGNGVSRDTRISEDGRFVVFQSFATNLVANDTNARSDIFVHDRTTGVTTRASVRSDGTQATGGESINPAISGDGRFVVFGSFATNLVANDSNGRHDIFVRDRGDLATGTFDLTPTDATVAVGERLTYAFTWTVPDPLNWHDLQLLQLRISDDDGSILWVKFDEASNTFSLFNEATGQFGSGGAPGSHHSLQTPQATLYLAETSVVASGQTGPSVTLNLSVSFKPQAAGHTFRVEVAASDDNGNADDFTQAGTLTVAPSPAVVACLFPSVTGRAHTVVAGTTDAEVDMDGRCTLPPGVNLELASPALTVTVNRLLADAGGDLVTPFTFDPPRGNNANSAVVKTPAQARPEARLTINGGPGQNDIRFTLKVRRATILRSPLTGNPTFTTDFVVHDGINQPTVVTFSDIWRNIPVGGSEYRTP